MVQINQPYLTLRLKFVKLGSLQYISHLDLVRTMHKVLIRTKLPLWYSEGFNPKPKMIFSQPLSIGAQSVTEYMDIRVTEKVSEDCALELLNENVTDELRFLDAYYPESKLSDIKYFSYTIVVNTHGADDTLAKKCEELLNAPQLIVSKKGKSGVSDVDIRPLISSASVVAENGTLRISCVLSADPSAVLNPEYVIKALKDGGLILRDTNVLNEYYSIMRDRAHMADMSEYR